MILQTRLNAAIITILFLALALTAMLAYFKFTATLVELQRSRAGVISLNLKHTIEAATDLGLSLVEVRNAQDVIDRARAADPQILSIAVFDRLGQVLFLSDPGGFAGRPTQVREGWLAANLAATAATWEAKETDAFVVGAPLLNPFEQPIGGVAVRLSDAPLAAKQRAMVAELVQVTGTVFFAVALIISLGVRFVFGSLIRAIRRMDGAAAQLATEGGLLSALPGNTAIERDFARFGERTAAAYAALGEAERLLEGRGT